MGSRKELVFATDRPNEHAYAQCANLQQLLDESSEFKVSLLPGFSTVHCLPYLSEFADLGFVKNFEISLASRGEYPYAKAYSNIKSIANIGSRGGVLHFGVLSSVGIRSFKDIAQEKYPLRLVVPEPAASSHHMTRFALEAYGITFEEIFKWGGRVTIELGGRGHLLGVSMVKKGEADAIAGSDYFPSTWISEIGSTLGINLLPVEPSLLDKVCEKYWLEQCIIPKETYPFLDEDVHSFKDIDVIATRDELSEDLVYRITKTICDSAARIRKLEACRFFDPRIAWKNIGPLHAGAEKYYREMGYL